MDGLPDGVHKAANRHVLFYMFRALAAILPPHTAPQSHSTPQFSGWGRKEVSLFDSILHSWGNQTLTLMLSLSLTGEITGQEGLSWY